MVAAYIVGTVIGAIAQHAVDEQIKQHKKQHPVPGEEPEGAHELDDPLTGTAAAPPG